MTELKGTLSVGRKSYDVQYKTTRVPEWGRSRSGYGSRMPTKYMVYWEGRWRRVYIAQHSNVGSAYIGPAHSWEGVFTL